MKDDELVRNILRRDRQALAAFYRTYTPLLRRLLLAKVQNPNDVEEILQDTLFGFLEAIRDFHGNASIKTFLFSICQHKIVDFYRKKKIKHVVFSQFPQLESLVSPIVSPEEEFDVMILKEKIRHVLARLLPIYRNVLTLKYLEDFSVEDIAKKLSITFKSAESRLFRARKAFVELFLST